MSAHRRAGRRALLALRAQLSERDMNVLRSVADLRFLTARQLEQLHFADHSTPLTAARTCRRVLERLTDQRLLHRLERRIGGLRAGSAAFVYGLGPIGDRVLHPDAERRRRWREPSATFLSHTLAVTDVVVTLAAAARTGRLALLTYQSEPHCWRTVDQGIAGAATLRPDLFVAFDLGEFEYRWFIEVDQATESLPAIVQKCRLYQDYWRTGGEQAAHGVFPKILWVAPHERRAQQLSRAIADTRSLQQELFAVTTKDAVVARLTEAGA